ncbi:hypothetical protein GRI69_08620 [Erythrobacter vulgaris]|uniref:Uncharacterized protein n=1 Tax=Qipengyuania vulgaris TaxID=291985 RepID=A0A844XTJ8_9SPHN|nr:hypothetical protein [Qipengyuania vulgaris]MXO48318.1 hypothetical protein [Qipengyuania vulgaris]
MHSLSKHSLVALAALGLLASPASAAFIGYLKIPPIDGDPGENAGIEPDEIDARAVPERAPERAATRTVERGAQRMAPRTPERAPADYLTIPMSETHSATGEHEVEYDLLAAKDEDGPRDLLPVIWETPAAQAGASGKRQHKPFVFTKEAAPATPARARTAEAPRSLPAPPSREGGSVTVAASWDGCTVGTRYPHVVVGGGDPAREYTLHGARVTDCAAEQVSFAYERVG